MSLISKLMGLSRRDDIEVGGFIAFVHFEPSTQRLWVSRWDESVIEIFDVQEMSGKHSLERTGLAFHTP